MLMQTETVPLPMSSGGSGEMSAISLRTIITILRRQIYLVLIAAVLGLVLAVVYLLIAPPYYKGSATLLLDSSMNNFLQKQNIVGDMTVDTGLVDSQVEVLNSESIALSVIKKLHLLDDPEFVGPPTDPLGVVIYQVGNFVRSVQDELGLKGAPSDADTPERAAVAVFQKDLSVKRVGLTYVLDIDFDSKSPDKAALIANTIASAYIESERDARFKSTKVASAWLEDRLAELSSQANDAERAVQKFKQENAIVDTGRGSMDQQQISDLNTQLTAAKGATAEAKARLDRVEHLDSNNISDATVSDALNNAIITRLSAQSHDLQSKAADLTVKVGPNHVAVLSLRKQIDELQRQIRNEVQRIAAAYRSDYEIATARQDSLEDSLSKLVGAAGVSGLTEVKLRDLTSQAEGLRTLHDSFLQKFQGAVQQESSPVTNTRVITQATVPIKKTSPKTILVLAAGLLAGLSIGSGSGLLREMWSDSLKTTDQVTRSLSVPCLGIVPTIVEKGQSRASSESSDFGMGEYVLKAPFSRYAEALRNLKVALDRQDLQRGVVGITSSLPREGKTILASNLASLIAVSGSRTLLIDGDLHQRTISRMLAPEARSGLIEALSAPAALQRYIQVRPRSNLHVLPCFMDKRTDRAADLLSSHEMEQLLNAARETYDYVLIDFAPIVPIVDAKAAAKFVDQFLYIVEWGITGRDTVSEALADGPIIRDRLTGVVLNRADPWYLRRLEASKSKFYGNYYQEA